MFLAHLQRLPVALALLLLLGCSSSPAPTSATASSSSASTPARAQTSAASADAVPIFRVTPLRPVEELRKEALAAQPPAETIADAAASDLVEVVRLEPGIHLDIRYATTNNFLSAKLYDEPRAFLQRPAAEALVRVHKGLTPSGFGLLIHDAYRPWYVTKMMWEATNEAQHDFVADPMKGSRHNRGCAVDLTLYTLATGKPVVMPSLYDEMTERAYPAYAGGTPEQRRLRDHLRKAMEAEGFTVNNAEWWHFDYKDWKRYAIDTVTFDRIGK
jgi:zinc D-Ala-D-Ala dipeptidase